MRQGGNQLTGSLFTINPANQKYACTFTKTIHVTALLKDYLNPLGKCITSFKV